MNRRAWVVAGCVLAAVMVCPAHAGGPGPGDLQLTPVEVPGLVEGAAVVRDVNGVPHVVARNDHDMFFAAGYVQAGDRLFQMDVLRRQGSGTLAELTGVASLASDVEARTIGLRRAAARSLPALSESSRAALQAFADGVNAFVTKHGLPLEYQLLGVATFEPWTPLDSVLIGRLAAFLLSFDLDIAPTQALVRYQQTGAAAGFDGAALFFADLWRSAPFAEWATVPEAGGSGTHQGTGPAREAAPAAPAKDAVHPAALALGAAYLERVRGLDLFRAAVDPAGRDKGSNEWTIGSRLAAAKRPLLANDPHLALNTPPIFYQIHMTNLKQKFDATGNAFPGTPIFPQGQNEFIAWGTTWNPLDVTDTYQEQVVPDGTSPSGLATLYMGALEPVLPVPEVFRYNTPADGTWDNLLTAPPGEVTEGVYVPAATLIVPRRNNGPIVALDAATGVALSVQYTGFSATREVDAVFMINRAQNLPQFIKALQLFDVGSQNWAYADVHGHSAYFTSGEAPLREDLQAMAIAGLPPAFIRNGQGGNEWIPDPDPGPAQAVPYEILPWEEMPKAIDPPRGWFVNANNDPVGATFDNNAYNQLRAGGGIYYLSTWYDFGARARRIGTLLAEAVDAGLVTPDECKRVQADVVLNDAPVFLPHLVAAFANAQAPGAHPDLVALAGDPRVADAVARLAAWDFTAPTGVPEGYDAADADGVLAPPGDGEIEASVAATIWSVFRGQLIRGAIDEALVPYGLEGPRDFQLTMTALRHLFDAFDVQQGVGASGIVFFPVAGVDDPAARRDIVLLRSLQRALDLLAGEAFAPAFGGATDPLAWRWGRLHRIVLRHPLGGPFDIPPAGGAFPPSFPDLPGLSVDGGFPAVDASNHDPRADAAHEFMFAAGPVRRYVGQMGKRPGTIRAETALAGGESGVLGSPWYVGRLPLWLTNDYYPVWQLVWTGPIADDVAEGWLLVPDLDAPPPPLVGKPPGHGKPPAGPPPGHGNGAGGGHGKGQANGHKKDGHKKDKADRTP